MQRFLTPVILFALLASLVGGSTSSSIGLATAFAAPDKPPVATPVTPPPSADAWKTLQRTTVAPQAASCTSSPFGRQLVVGGENEIFVSYNNESPGNTGLLTQHRFDRADNGDIGLQQSLSGADLDADQRLKNSNGGSSVIADLNGDGRNEFVQVTRDGASNTRIVVSTRNGASATRTSWRGTTGDYNGARSYSATAGNFQLQQDSPAQQLAVAFVTAAGNVHVDLWSGAANGSIAQADNALLAQWHDVAPGSIKNIGLTAADVNGDGYDELALLVQYSDAPSELYVLSNRANKNIWTILARTELDAQHSDDSMSIQGGDIDGDFNDEIVLAYSNPNIDSATFSDQVGILAIKYDTTAIQQGDNKLPTYNTWRNTTDSDTLYRGLSLTLADTDQDGVVEPVLTFWSSSPSRMNVVTLDAEQPIVLEHNRWFGPVTNDGVVSNVAVDAADLNKDGYADIVVAYLDTNNLLKVMRLEDQAMPSKGIALRRTWSEASTNRSNMYSLVVRMGDWDNNSLMAISRIGDGTTLGCRQVEEPQVTSAVFIPPTWQNIQPHAFTGGSIGKATSTSVTTDTAYIAEHSHSATVSLGFGIDGEAASIAVRATAGREWSQSQTNAGSTSNSETIATGAQNTKDFVLVDSTDYYCYTYQGNIGPTKLTDSLMRLCRYNGVAKETTSIDSWDDDVSSQIQWSPIVRDWASLTQFRGPFTAQSSTAGTNSAANAVDGNVTLFKAANSRASKNPISETSTQTADNSAWWQVDLGSAQDITKIRLWNGDDPVASPSPRSAPQELLCICVQHRLPLGPQLQQYQYPDRHNGIQKYRFPDTAGEVISFLTKVQNPSSPTETIPITGRYVRVQLVDSGSLALSEVQVLGVNSVEPNRYPTSVRPGPAGSGYFFTTLYNPATRRYEEKRSRGTILWNGVDHDVLKDVRITSGGGTVSWALSQGTARGTTTATSIGNNYSVGAEIDVSLGVIAKGTAGASYQYTRGVTTEHSSTYEYGKDFEISGTVESFPKV